MFAVVPSTGFGHLLKGTTREHGKLHSSRRVQPVEPQEKTPRELAIDAAAKQLDIANADLTSAERALKNATGDNGKQEALKAKAAAFQAVQAARKALNIAKNS